MSLPVATPAPTPNPSRKSPVKERHLRAVESFTPGATVTPTLPPALAVQKLALYAFEAIEGHRPVAHLGRAVSPEAIDELLARRSCRVEARTLVGDTRRVVPIPGAPRMSVPRPGVLECVVVLQTPRRAHAVALRFECEDGRWQATCVDVL